jgi:hypothetical protein
MEKKEELKNLSLRWFKKDKQDGYKYISKHNDVWCECAFFVDKQTKKYKMYVKYDGQFIKKHILLRGSYDAIGDLLLDQMLKDNANVMIQDLLNGKIKI